MPTSSSSIWIQSSNVPQPHANLHHSSRAPRRGQKAKIQLIDDGEEFPEVTPMGLPGHPSGEPTQEASMPFQELNFVKDESPHTLPEGATTPGSSPSPRFKSFVENVVSNPMVTYFSCNSRDENEDEDMTPWWQWWFGYARLEQAMKKGAPKVVVQTMKQFPQQARVQCIGCGALQDMAVDSWPRKQEVAEAGSIDVMLKAMRIHLVDAKVQELACRCFYELVAGHIADWLVQKGVVASVLAAMEAHPEDEDVLPVACDVLLALTDHGPSAVECLRHKLGGVLLAKLEHFFRGRNGEISRKSGDLLKRLYV